MPSSLLASVKKTLEIFFLRKDVHYATSVLRFIGNPRYSSYKEEERKRNKMRKGGGKKEGGGALR